MQQLWGGGNQTKYYFHKKNHGGPSFSAALNRMPMMNDCNMSSGFFGTFSDSTPRRDEDVHTVK